MFGIACLVLAFGAGVANGNETQFPFDGELILDVDPMPGSKRIPNMDIAANGAIALELWCNRIDGQMIVAADTITVLTGSATTRTCTPAQARSDEELVGALSQVTNWRREGTTVLLIGPKTLRFRIPTN
jgi:heat shock protein HslJ